MKISSKILFLFTISFILLIYPVFSIPASAQTEDDDWQPPINLSKSGANSDPIFLIDSYGKFQIIWKDTYNLNFVFSSWDGNTWSTPNVGNFPFPYENNLLKLVADNQGKIHAFWTDSENDLYYSRVLAENFSTLPSQWITAQLLESSVAGIDISVDGNNNVHLAIMRSENLKNNITPGVFYMVYSNENAVWSQTTELDSSSYLRTVTPDESNIDIALAENSIGLDSVFIAWSNPSRARLFFVSSTDAGVTWDSPVEIVGPNAAFGIVSPFDIMIEANEDQLLALWKVRDAGNNCSQEYKWSIDQGKTWSDQKELFDSQTGCPEENHLYKTDNGEFLLFSFINKQPSFLAWNGSSWSNPQPQYDFVNFLDPDTKRNLDLQCREAALHGNSFYVVGCDLDLNQDIWITSRQIRSTEGWFPSPSSWNTPEILTNPNRRISSLISVADKTSAYLFWVQSSWSDTQTDNASIHYARWNGNQWTFPSSIIVNVGGIPIQLNATLDNQGRLLLIWVNQQTGELLFSWANADRANISVEWSEPIVLPAPSNIVSSPDILIDAAGKIVIAYAVPLNEDRGLYFIESDDAGTTWSKPTKIINAIDADWDLVDQPKIILAPDGHLHLLFTQYAIEGPIRKPITLFYTQSRDGGNTWSTPETVSEGLIQWSDLIRNGETIHRLWQEKTELVVVNNDQVSLDSGETWMRKNTISGNNSGKNNSVNAIYNHLGYLHFVQLININEMLLLQDWFWDGASWVSDESIELSSQNLDGKEIQSSISACITSDGVLNVAILVDFVDYSNELQNNITNIRRMVGEPILDEEPDLFILASQDFITNTNDIQAQEVQAEIATPIIQATDSATKEPEITVTPTTSNQTASQKPPKKNVVGLVLVGIVFTLMLSLIFAWKQFSAMREKRNNSR
jgi:hypothetical protein